MVIVEPPFETGGTNVTISSSLPGVMELIVGAPGVVTGVPDTDVDEDPAPIEFTARRITEYNVPFVKPVIVKGDVVPADTQFDPLSKEY